MFCLRPFFRILSFIFLLGIGSVVVAQVQVPSVQDNPLTVRVRLFKDLPQFPEVRQAVVKAVRGDLWSVQGQGLRYQGQWLPNLNFVFKKASGFYDFVSVVEWNSYLAGVLSREMPLKWPLEALKAQAVVARSYALARMKERRQQFFHLDATQLDQVFSLTASVKAYQAVRETDRLILQTSDGEVLKAYYHSDCGGQTVPASQIWPTALDTGTARDPWCAARSSNRWKLSLPRESFDEKIQQKMIGQASEASAFEVKKWQSKIVQLIWKGHFFSVQKLREWFGFSVLKSSPSRVIVDERFVTFLGSGYGHGAGLCQWGTFAQAQSGIGFEAILSHYYPKARLVSQSKSTLVVSK